MEVIEDSRIPLFSTTEKTMKYCKEELAHKEKYIV